MKRSLVTAAGLLVAAGLGALWLRAYGHLLHPPGAVHPVFLLLGCLALPVAALLQIVRTGLLFGLTPRAGLARLARPLLLSMGINTMLPSLAGDLAEVALVSRTLGLPARTVLAVLMFRFSLSMSAVLLLGTAALATVAPGIAAALAVLLVAAPFVADRTWSWWTRLVRLPGAPSEPVTDYGPFGPAQTAGHLALVLGIQGVLTAGLWCLGRGLEQGVDLPTALGMVSAVDLAGYLPVPLAGAGLHHWGAAGAAELLHRVQEAPALLVATNHAWTLVLGGGALLVGVFARRGGDTGR
ncbi:MAG: hypothetical protein ABIO70_24010 [Pseudomonadota bacterium]